MMAFAKLHEMTPEEREAALRFMRSVNRTFRQFQRAMAGLTDAMRLTTDSVTRADRREWEFPENVLTDEEREEIEARQMGRTLEDIDDLPESNTDKGQSK